MNTKKYSDREKLDSLTNTIVNDILEMADSEISDFASETVGSEKKAAKEFDSIVESALAKRNSRAFVEIGERLKKIESNKAHELGQPTSMQKQHVSHMIQRNEEIADLAAHYAEGSDDERPSKDDGQNKPT